MTSQIQPNQEIITLSQTDYVRMYSSPQINAITTNLLNKIDESLESQDFVLEKPLKNGNFDQISHFDTQKGLPFQNKSPEFV